MSRICDVTFAMDHVVRFTRPSGSVLHTASNQKQAGEGLGTRLVSLMMHLCMYTINKLMVSALVSDTTQPDITACTIAYE